MTNTETTTRTKDGVVEHRHSTHDWWHSVARIHTQKVDRTGQKFFITCCGVGCGHWENEPDRGGYRNACDECQEQNGPCHVEEKVVERGGIPI